MIDKQEPNSKDIATSQEINDAYVAFTAIEASKLKRCAIAKEPWGDKYFDYQDLIHGAYISIINGETPWVKSKRSFLNHMFNVIRSHAGHWKRIDPETKKKDAVYRKWVDEKVATGLTLRAIENLVFDAQANSKPQLIGEDDHIQNLPGKETSNPEKQIILEQESETIYSRIEKLFSDDEEALLVVWELSIGTHRVEIQTNLGINENAFYTIRRRIIRKVEKLKKGELRHG